MSTRSIRPFGLTALLFTITTALTAQADTAALEAPYNSCAPMMAKRQANLRYNWVASTQTHDFSGNWDFDGDGSTDELYFIGTGGAHLYFYLRLVLSSNKRVHNFSFLSIDMPCPGTVEEVEADSTGTQLFPQFAAGKFIAGDVADRIYIHLDHSAFIPARWKQRGVTTRRLIISYRKGQIIIRNYKK